MSNLGRRFRPFALYAELAMDLYEALYTTRAMRRVKPDPIPEGVVKAMLDAAVRAPSGSNMQQWRMVVVTDPVTRAALGELYHEAYRLLHETVYAGRRHRADERLHRLLSSSDWLGDHFGAAPLIVLFFDRNDPTGASIYPAVWSLMLAGRGHGIGTTLTTVLGMFKEAEVMRLLGVPEDKGWVVRAAVPCGYPLGRWGLAERRPAHEVVFADRWGQAPAWTIDRPLWEA